MPLTSVDNQNEFNDCICEVRPITFDEAREYNDLLVNEDLTDYYWTITPWSTAERGFKYAIVVVSPSGSIISSCYCYDDNGCGVRPLCIFSPNLFESE